MVAFRSSATATNTGGADGIAVTVTKPAGTVNDDLMVAVTHGYTGDTTFAAPSGWTFVSAVDDSTGLRSRCYTKVAAAEGASYLWQFQPTPGGGAIGVSISSFSSASGLDSWDVAVTSTTDPSAGTALTPARTAMRYAVYCWRDTTADAVTWSIGTEAFDVQAIDAGTIVRGQSGAYHDANNGPGEVITANTANPTNSVERGIHWSFAVGDAAPAAEDWDSSGFALEMDLGGWTDITGYRKAEPAVETSRGKSSEGSASSPSQASFTLDNRSGRFSPRNPTGDYYGLIGRNTPVRISKAHGTIALRLQGARVGETLVGDRITTVARAALEIPGDIDIRLDLQPESWRQKAWLAGRYRAAIDLDNAWACRLEGNGCLSLLWFDPANASHVITSTRPVPQGGRQALRFTLDVDNGASGNTVVFYTSDTIAGAWTQLGDPVVTAGTTTIDASVRSLSIGAAVPGYDGSFNPLHGAVHHFELRSGIAGTLVSDVDFTTQATGTYAVTENDNLWIAAGNAVISNRRYRMHGEMSEYKEKWDSTDAYAYVEAEAAGIRRRLEQGKTPLKSAMFRAITSGGSLASPAVAYWSCEDVDGSTFLAGGLGDGTFMRITGTPELASSSVFDCSSPLPVPGTAIFKGLVPAHTATTEYQTRWLMSLPPGGEADNDILLRVVCTGGTGIWWDMVYATGGSLYVSVRDRDGVELDQTGPIGFGIDGLPVRASLEMVQNGADVDVVLATLEPNAGVYEASGDTFTGITFGRVTGVIVNPTAADLGTVFGHISVQADATRNISDLGQELAAFANESAGDRVRRLCLEEGIEFRSIGNLNDGTKMGPQGQKAFLALLAECEASDGGGFVYEPRDVLGLGYRDRKSQYNNTALLALEYDAGHISGDLWPAEDDPAARNDVTVTRDGGSSARVVQETGPMSVQPPPDGIGRYDDAPSLSLYRDLDCPDQAGWRVFQGTVNEARYKVIRIALENPRFTADSALTEAALAMDQGDLVTVSGMPARIPPELIEQQVIGYRETFDQFTHAIDFYCMPDAARQVAVYGTDRYDSATTTLNEDLTTTETAVDIAVASGPLWTTSVGGGFDIMIGGERMTVTAITGATSPQTATVVRSVNGIVKTHSTGAPVRLFQTPHRAL